MPVPGPRTQHRPVPGYRNPEGELPDRINHWQRPGPLWWPGRSPGTMVVTLRGCVLGAGQVRRLWKQSVNLVNAQGAYSWSRNGNDTNPRQAFGVTRALRYMTRSFYMGQGIDNTRFDGLHSEIINKVTYKTVTVNAGQQRNNPTVRNRMTSFGSRAPTLNQAVQAAQSQSPGQSSQ